jgi:hypothetical protein
MFKMATLKNGARRCAARPNGPYGIDAKSQCRQPTHRATAALCKKHEAMWKIENRARRDARKAAEDALLAAE